MLRRLGEADRRTRPDLADRAPIISRIADLLIAIGITRANLDVLEERAVVEIILGVAAERPFVADAVLDVNHRRTPEREIGVTEIFGVARRSEEHKSELQSPTRSSYDIL